MFKVRNSIKQKTTYKMEGVKNLNTHKGKTREDREENLTRI